MGGSKEMVVVAEWGGSVVRRSSLGIMSQGRRSVMEKQFGQMAAEHGDMRLGNVVFSEENEKRKTGLMAGFSCSPRNVGET